MRLGIYLNNITADSGGSFTIEHEMLQAILAKLKYSDITPVVFSSNNEIKLDAAYVDLAPRMVDKIKNLVYKWITVFQKGEKSYSAKRKKNIIEANALDLFLYLTPLIDFKLDIPYITVVWDLQHRLQPFFPEVSQLNVFEEREKIYNDKLKKATYIMCGTERGKQELSHFYNIWPDRIKVVPFFVPSFVLKNNGAQVDVVEKYKIRKCFLFYPAQFWPHKNHINLLLAFKKILDSKKYDVDLVLVGSDKGNKSYVQDFVVDNKMQGNVKFLGFIPTEDLVAFYKKAVALTFVTYFGPDNLPPLEAFASGCPVIASNVPGSLEQLEDAAFFVDPNNYKEIAGAIEKIMDDEALRNSLKQKGQNLASKKTSDVFGQKVYDIVSGFNATRINWK